MTKVNGQEDWVSKEHARRDDLITSHLAATSMQGSAKAIAQRVLAVLIETGPGTFYEVAVRANLDPAQVWKRMSDLKNWGCIEASGQTRKGPSGRQQTVWRVRPFQVSLL